jgi:hypothetical protein
VYLNRRMAACHRRKLARKSAIGSPRHYTRFAAVDCEPFRFYGLSARRFMHFNRRTAFRDNHLRILRFKCMSTAALIAAVRRCVIGNCRDRPPFGTPTWPNQSDRCTVSRCAGRSTSHHSSATISPRWRSGLSHVPGSEHGPRRVGSLAYRRRNGGHIIRL